MTERKQPGVSWDSFIEHQIHEAQEAGKFDNLPGFGQPIPGIDEPLDEMWWVRKKLRSEELSLLPPSLQIRADVAKTMQMVWTLRDEAAVRDAIESLNQRIREANFANYGPPSTTMPLDIEQIVAEWRSRKKSPRPPS